MTMRTDLELCCNCNYSEYVDFNDRTMIKCNKQFCKSKNVRDTFHVPLFSKFKPLTAYACGHFEKKKV